MNLISNEKAGRPPPEGLSPTGFRVFRKSLIDAKSARFESRKV